MPAYVPNPRPGAPTPADLFEGLGSEMASRYAAAEEIMIQRVADLARRGIDIPPSVSERLKVLRQLREEGEAIAESLRDPAFVRRMVAIAAADGEAAAIARLGIASRLGTTSAITPAAANAIGSISLDLSNSLDDMSARITRWMPDAYRNVISQVAPNVILGVDTLLDAKRKAAETFLARGVRGFTDNAGKEWRIGTYAEMSTRTTVNRAWMDANIAVQHEAGINLVQIVIGVNACNKCAQHAGKIYSTDGTPGGVYQLEHATEDRKVSVTVTGTLDSARAAGWNHPNCRCVVVAYLPGLARVSGTTHDPVKEAARDRLRELERRVRDLKRREIASFDDVTAARYKARIREAQRDIREHVDETGLIRRRYREQLGFSDGPTTPRTPPGPRPVAPPPPKALPPAQTPTVNKTPTITPEQRAARKARLQAEANDKAKDVPFSDDLARARLQTGRPGIVNAKTNNDLDAALRNALQGRNTRIAGFESGVSLTSSKEFALGIVDMLAKYPRTALNAFSIETGVGRNVLGSARSLFSNGRIYAGEIRGSKAYFGSRTRLVDAHERSTEGGHFHANTADPGRYVAIHEFGHILDYMSQNRLRAEVTGIRNKLAIELGHKGGQIVTDHQAIAAYTSKYGNGSTPELIAESFADVELNGDGATELSKRIHARLLELLVEEGML